jgi:hypothetical protein
LGKPCPYLVFWPKSGEQLRRITIATAIILMLHLECYWIPHVPLYCKGLVVSVKIADFAVPPLVPATVIAELPIYVDEL